MTESFPADALALRDGDVRMPLLGFGTWRLSGDQARRAVACALEAGYRHLDTATMYENEAEVGAALRESGLARDEVFVTTKLLGGRRGAEGAELAASLDRLGLDHVDLWLVHWPTDDGTDVPMWRAFLDARERGLARAVGVSNFSLGQVDRLVAATGGTPAVNQVEWSPLLFDPSVLAGHRERGIALEGYSALRRGAMEHATVRRIAESHARTPAQVVIRWHLQHRVVVIPKSADPVRIRANAQVSDFSLSPDDMAELDGLGAATAR
jgi:diketogulonate reductase-like aldo/keto reductase